jgi:tRNA(His) 5'-end guanylyltransferase
MLMSHTLTYLMQETQARVGYTQSDEISLVYFADDPDSQIYYDGKMQKLTSVLASLCTAYFNQYTESILQRDMRTPAIFDCRVWQVPSLDEAANYIVWRELDAKRNSVQSLARSCYSHKTLLGKKEPELHDMLHAAGKNWSNEPDQFKRGLYCIRKQSQFDSDAVYLQTACIPPILHISNRVGVLFYGEEPKLITVEGTQNE